MSNRIDLHHYTIRERVQDPDGEVRYLIPWSDPHLYEFPLDVIFPTLPDLRDWVVDTLDPDEIEDTWVVMEVRATAVDGGLAGLTQE